MGACNIIEEDALEAYDNGDEQKCFDLYMELIDSLDWNDIDEEEFKVSFEFMSCQCFGRFKCAYEKPCFETWVCEDFFTEEHKKQLKEALEDQMELFYEGAWDAWDMSTHPWHYLPD